MDAALAAIWPAGGRLLVEGYGLRHTAIHQGKRVQQQTHARHTLKPVVLVPQALYVFSLTGSHFPLLANERPRRKPLPKQRPFHGAGRSGGYFSLCVQSVMACMRAVA